MSRTDVKDAVRERYSQAAQRVSKGKSCCGGDAALEGASPIISNLYDVSEKSMLPEAAVLASLGCGNPTALAQLQPGEIVLDLGSGGGIDVLLSARRVGPTGKAYGLDMTDEMLALARENQKKAGVENVEFLKGEIEAIPLPDNSVDVIISNCVINLSGDTDRVLKEAFRVLKPGGRFAVSDIVTRGDVPEDIRRNMLAWAGCIAGALDENDYAGKLVNAGFEAVGVEPTRIYKGEDAREFLSGKGINVDEMAGHIDGKFMSAFVRAVKPKKTCCCSQDAAMDGQTFNVLFLCTGNTARSIMAEGILRKDGAGRFNAFSAGSQPKGTVNPYAIKTLAAYGYPAEDFRSKSWDEYAAPGAPKMDFVFTVCDNAAGEVCPFWPGQPMTAHWGIEDPAAIQGTDIDKQRAFNEAFRYLRNRITAFTALPLRSIGKLALSAQLKEIGHMEGSTSGTKGSQ